MSCLACNRRIEYMAADPEMYREMYRGDSRLCDYHQLEHRLEVQRLAKVAEGGEDLYPLAKIRTAVYDYASKVKGSKGSGDAYRDIAVAIDEAEDDFRKLIVQAAEER